MKKLLLILGFALYNFISAHAVNLVWPASVTSTTTGYKIYFGPKSHVYNQVVDFSSAMTGFVPTPSGVPYYFSVTAYNANGTESDFSQELIYNPHDALIESCDVIKGGTWKILRHEVLDMTFKYRLVLAKDQLLRVQVSDDDGISWGDKFSIPVSFTPEHQFFRMTIL